MTETQGLAFRLKNKKAQLPRNEVHQSMKQESKEIQQIEKYVLTGPHLGFSPWGDDVGIPHVGTLMN